MNHGIPGKSSTVVVFEWQPNYDFGGFLERVRLTKAEVPTSWMSYNQSTRVYDSFRNEWDLCDALDPTSLLGPEPSGTPTRTPKKPEFSKAHKSATYAFRRYPSPQRLVPP
jgi:hypothetical protein